MSEIRACRMILAIDRAVYDAKSQWEECSGSARTASQVNVLSIAIRRAEAAAETTPTARSDGFEMPCITDRKTPTHIYKRR